MAHAWKACIRQRIEGSNPSLSASIFIKKFINYGVKPSIFLVSHCAGTMLVGSNPPLSASIFIKKFINYGVKPSISLVSHCAGTMLMGSNPSLSAILFLFTIFYNARYVFLCVLIHVFAIV
jgi:hypothetical protein